MYASCRQESKILIPMYYKITAWKILICLLALQSSMAWIKAAIHRSFKTKKDNNPKRSVRSK